MAKFSVIIPAHNAADRINRAIESVLAQSFHDYELIIVCDSCEDNTEEIARSVTDKVYVCDYSNDGMTRNVGLDHATGEWILFMDDDDWWLHEFAFKMLADKCDLYGDGIDMIVFAFIFKHIGYAPPYRNHGALWPNVWSKCWRREFIGEHRFKNIPMESDLHFCREILMLNPKVITFEQPLYYYNYMRPGSLTEVASRNDSQTIS